MIFFICDHNTQKVLTFNETCVAVSISDLFISEGLYFYIAQKPRAKKVLYLAIKFSKGYQPPNRNLTYKDLWGVIHNQNMERNSILTKTKSYIFGLSFLGNSDTIYRTPLLKILVSEKIFQ